MEVKNCDISADFLKIVNCPNGDKPITIARTENRMIERSW